jgi:hypothetical protein
VSWHFGDSTPTAAREHRCHLCDELIAKGETHVRRTGIVEGSFVGVRMHLKCEALTGTWSDHDWENYEPDEFRAERDAYYAKKAKGT